jgi:hypothetical protein
MQACAFKGDTCPSRLGECDDVCAINGPRVTSRAVAEDRSFGEDWWSMCPRLAQVVAALQPITRRQLLGTDSRVRQQCPLTPELSITTTKLVKLDSMIAQEYCSSGFADRLGDKADRYNAVPHVATSRVCF